MEGMISLSAVVVDSSASEHKFEAFLLDFFVVLSRSEDFRQTQPFLMHSLCHYRGRAGLFCISTLQPRNFSFNKTLFKMKANIANCLRLNTELFLPQLHQLRSVLIH